MYIILNFGEKMIFDNPPTPPRTLIGKNILMLFCIVVFVKVVADIVVAVIIVVAVYIGFICGQ